ncbi:MAG: polysaccharide biosynthesis/export family protein [Pseudomonadota bacterium]
MVQKAPVASAESAGILSGPQVLDYEKNQRSDVFGAQLFTGAFAYQGSSYFNPDYLIAAGDTLQVRLWGAFEFDTQLVVDPQGNIFLPHVGPVAVRGVRNSDLQRVMDTAVRRVFRANVNSYASLVAAQPVRVFVGGNVYRPGLYSGTSMDSLLRYLDQAGGIDPERGSFLNVQVMRGNQVRNTVNLYDFLLKGSIPLIQLNDGDVIFVQPRMASLKVSGLVENAKRFEFSEAGDKGLAVEKVISLAKPRPSATHVRVVRNKGTTRNTEYFPIGEMGSVRIENGDELEFTADKKPGTISVRVEGEHMSAQEYVLPYGSRLGVLLSKIQFNERSETESLQLFRLSVKERQQLMLNTSLRSLESALLTARSGSSDEARLRKEEAELTLQWVDRAKKIEPLGQVVIAQASRRDDLLLENGDVIRVPTRDGLVLISGEVLFPNAVAHEPGTGLQTYIDRAGGYTQNSENARIVIARASGSFDQINAREIPANLVVRAGDQILVLPKVDEKKRQFWKDMTQIIFQIAVSAKVVLGL